MDELIQRFGDWWRAYMARLRKRNVWLWLLAVLLVGTAAALSWDKWIGVLGPYLEPLRRGIGDILEAPLWAGGIIFLGYLAMIATLAYEDVRPPRPDVANLSKEVVRLADEVKRVELERDDWKRDSRERRWRHEYGTAEPDLGDTCATEARKEVEKLRPRLIELRNLVGIVMQELVRYHSSQGAFAREAVALLEERVCQGFRASVELLNAANVDLRVALLMFDENYNAVRKWLVTMLFGAQNALRTDEQPQYKTWYDADQAYFTELSTLLEISEFGSTKRALTIRRSFYEYPVDVPEPQVPGTRAVLTVIRPSDPPPSDPDSAAGPPSVSAS